MDEYLKKIGPLKLSHNLIALVYIYRAN